MQPGLAKRGANVTGIDFSKTSITYAREVAAGEQLAITYVNQDCLQFETDDRFDLVLMIMCDFCALSPAQRKRMLGKFHKILKPSGSVLLDVYSLIGFEQREEAATCEVNQLAGFWLPNRYYGFLNTFKHHDEKVILDKYTIVESRRTKQVFNWLQYFSLDDLEREFVDAGFHVKGIYSDVAGNPHDPKSSEFAVVASKT